MTPAEQQFLHNMSQADRNRAGDAFNAIWPTVAGPHPNLADKWAKAIPGLHITTGVTARDFTKPWVLSYSAGYDVDRTSLTASQIADALDAIQLMRPLIVRGWKRQGYAGAGMPAPRAEGDQYTYRPN